jgi:hypothetical protein
MSGWTAVNPGTHTVQVECAAVNDGVSAVGGQHTIIVTG